MVSLHGNYFAVDHVLGALAIYGVLAFSILRDQLTNSMTLSVLLEVICCKVFIKINFTLVSHVMEVIELQV